MKKWILPVMLLSAASAVTAAEPRHVLLERVAGQVFPAGEGQSSLRALRFKDHEIVPQIVPLCCGNRLKLLFCGGGAKRVYEVVLRKGFFVKESIKIIDVTGFAVEQDKDRKRVGLLYGEEFPMNRTGKILMLCCEALVGEKRQAFEVELSNFCELDLWRKVVFPEEQKASASRRGTRYRRKRLQFDNRYSNWRTRELTDEECNAYFVGVAISDESGLV